MYGEGPIDIEANEEKQTRAHQLPLPLDGGANEDTYQFQLLLDAATTGTLGARKERRQVHFRFQMRGRGHSAVASPRVAAVAFNPFSSESGSLSKGRER